MPSILSRFGSPAATSPDNIIELASSELHPLINKVWSMVDQFIQSVRTKSSKTQLSIGALSGYLSAYCFLSVSKKLAYFIGIGLIISEIYTGETWTWKLRIPSTMSFNQYLPTFEEFSNFVCNLSTLAVGFIGGAFIGLSM